MNELPYCDFCDQARPPGVILIQPSDGPAICETCVEMLWHSLRIAQAEAAGGPVYCAPGSIRVPIGGVH